MRCDSHLVREVSLVNLYVITQCAAPAHSTHGLRQTAASVRQSGLRESAASDLSADYSFLNSYSILLILHQKFSLASRMFLLTDVWQPWNDLQSVLANCATAVICQIRQYKFLNVCFCDLLPFFLCFLGSCLGDVHKTFFLSLPTVLFPFGDIAEPWERFP